MVVLAVLIGLVAGLIGILPFIILVRLMRTHASLRGMLMVPAGFFAVLVSTLILAAALLTCALLFRTLLVAFALACIPVFLLGACVFALRGLRPRQQRPGRSAHPSTSPSTSPTNPRA